MGRPRLLCLAGALLALGCSSEGDDGANSGTGGAASGGAASGGAASGGVASGGVATGGTATGGTTTGGSATGGTATGGTATGGATTGGSATGGTATGGATTGGTATGGATTGGSATGGATTGGSATGGATTGGSATGGSATGGSATGGVATGGASTGGAGAGTGICGAADGQLFGGDHPWNQRIDQATLDGESATIIDYLQTNHTASARFRIDGPSDEADNQYGIVVLHADGATVREPFTPTGDFYSPDCDPADIPVPAGGFIEGEAGYQCDSDGDCHLIVIDPVGCRLYEMWRANRTSSEFFGGCQAVWDLTETYTPTLRGDCCTSADAAGLPIAAHLFDADEIFAGVIPHAIRFILPNELMRSRVYVRPATHSTPATTGPASAPPYGARLRLRSSVDLGGLKPAARVVAQALKDYGMILSDGGNLTFTAANDRLTTHRWAEVDLTAGDLTSLEWSDFEVVELGQRFTFDAGCDCQRTPLTD